MVKTSMNIEENIASMLCYIGVWVTGLIFYLLEKENKTVKFHAMQSLLTFIGVFIVYFVIFFLTWFVPFMWMLSILFGLLVFILWIILVIKAYQGEKFKLPIIGDIAEKEAQK
jgi:uncharacterized membrane protein